MTILVTGGCGFIGTNFIYNFLSSSREKLVNIDKLTYAANQETSKIVHPNYQFVQVDIVDTNNLHDIISQYKPRLVVHFAAETHVDRSIKSPINFVNTNIMGTYSLLKACLEYYTGLSGDDRNGFKLINVSTDEVYGELELEDQGFTEDSTLAPNNPYSASKASADLLARSFYKTYGLPVITARCSNNFGPYQHKEKFIPKIVYSVKSGEHIPIYGQGRQRRDWLFVLDHVDALITILRLGQPGQIYNIGGGAEIENRVLAMRVCKIAAQLLGREPNTHVSLIKYVDDRPGHDFRYAMRSDFLESVSGWKVKHSFDKALEKTIAWYLFSSEKS